MSEKRSESVKTLSLSIRTAVGLSLGLAFTIPLAQPAMARQDRPHISQHQAILNGLRNQRDGGKRQASLNSVQGANFNLNSGREVFSAANLGNFTDLMIDVGGRQRVVNLDTKLTAAEVVAAQQVLSGQGQSIRIGNGGAAVGGTVTLNDDVLTALNKSVGGSISSLTVARNVQVIDNVSNVAFAGTLKNFGTISMASDAVGANNTISADNIFNARTGTIGSYNGADLFAADATLNAATYLINNGRISSANNLSISAPTIVNANDGDLASISAGQNVNLNTENLINTGLIAAGAGNVNVVSNAALNVMSSGGTLQAYAGKINLSANNSDLTINGGNLNSLEVNLNAGHGTIEATVDDASGQINAKACIVHLYADTDDLHLGSIEATGDPIITNTGNIGIDNAIAPTNGNPLTLIAGGNIVSNTGNTGLNTSNAAGDGGDLTLIAGATFTMKDGNVVVSKGSATGGTIDLTGGSGGSSKIFSLNTTGSTGFTGGDVLMIAFASKSTPNGFVTLPVSVVLDTTGSAVSGDVTIFAGGTGSSINTGFMNANNVSINAATPTAKGGLVFDGTTGAHISGVPIAKKLSTGDILAQGIVSAQGDLTINTLGTLTVNGILSAQGTSKNVNISAAKLDVPGLIESSTDSTTANINVSGDTTISGGTNVGAMNLNTGTLTINGGGVMSDAFENLSVGGLLQVDGTLGRNPGSFDPVRATTILNVNAAGAFKVSAPGIVSGDGAISAASFLIDGTSKGSISYTVTGKKGATFTNNGLIDGLFVTITSPSITNSSGASLQATMQTLPSDVPTLTLNTSLLDNQGHIEAVGEQKKTDGSLVINSKGDLTITGKDGGFFTAFSSGVELNANGDIFVGGNDGVKNSNPFSALTSGLGTFKVNTSGSFFSTISGVTVNSDGKGEHGEIDIAAKSLLYNGIGAAPTFALVANGDINSDGRKPITVSLTDKKLGLVVGSKPGNLSIDVNNFDSASTTSLTASSNLKLDMANLDNGGTSLELTGNKSLLITGNVIGGDNVTIKTSGAGFQIGNATTNGQTGITVGQGISAIKNLTITVPGSVTIDSGAVLRSDEAVNLNAIGLKVNMGGDVADLNLAPTPLTLTLDTGESKTAFYTNLNPNGAISAAIMTINAVKTLTLSSGSSSKVETILSVGTNPNSSGGLGGGGTFNINADSIAFSPAGITFNAASPGLAAPNGGQVNLNFTTKNAVTVGLGKNEIRANVAANVGFDGADGSGQFSLTTAGNIVVNEIYNKGAGPFSIDFGLNNITHGGRLVLTSTLKGTVQISDIDGIGLNLLELTTPNKSPLRLSDANANGIKDQNPNLFVDKLSATNFGSIDFNGVVLNKIHELEVTSTTGVDFSKTKAIGLVTGGSTGIEVGGIINVNAPTITVDNKLGLALSANGGTISGASVSLHTAELSGGVKIGTTGDTISIDVSKTQNNIGADVSIIVGGPIRLDGDGLNFGAATNVGASLTLQSGQATKATPGNVITFENANSTGLLGLSLGTVDINSGSILTFKLDGANTNGFTNGAFTAGAISIQSRSGDGIIDATGYKMVTHSLTLKAFTINFADKQTISVVDDNGVVGTGANTGIGGTIDITTDTPVFGANPILLVAQGDALKATSTGGTISISSTNKSFALDGSNYTFDVSDSGGGPGQKSGNIIINQLNGSLDLDGSVFKFAANDGGTLKVTADGNMLFSNVDKLSAADLDGVFLQTNGASNGPLGVFQFSGATANGFSGVSPILGARAITIVSNGKSAGIDTANGALLTHDLTLSTSGNVNFASGSVLNVLADGAGEGGNLSITANALTQSNGSSGFTLGAPGGAGFGGNIILDITGSGDLNIGAGSIFLNVANVFDKSPGTIDITNGGNIFADISAINFGTKNFGNASLALNANGILHVSNLASIQNVGFGSLTLNSRSTQAFVLGGAKPGTNGIQDAGLDLNIGSVAIGNSGSVTTATISGSTKPGGVDSITVVDSSLPGGQITVSYTFQSTDNTADVAAGLAALINSDLDLQALGVSATTNGSVISLLSTAPATTYFDSVAKGSQIEFATVASGGDIEMGSMLSLGFLATSSVTLNASGTMGIFLTSSAGTNITANAGKDVSLTTNQGAASINVNAGGNVSIVNQTSSIGNVSGTGQSFNFKQDSIAASTDTVKLSNISTTNGDLNIIGNANHLILDGTFNATNGNISVQTSNVNGSTDIQILDDTTMLASGQVTALNQGNIYIVIGSLPPAFTPDDGVAPAGVTINETAGGQVTFGSGAFPGGSIVADKSDVFEGLGRNLVFSTSFLPSSAITIGKNVVITADPPPMVPGQLIQSAIANSGTTSSSSLPASFAGTAGSPAHESFARAVTNSVPRLVGTSADSTYDSNVPSYSPAASSISPAANSISSVAAPDTLNLVPLNNAGVSELSNMTLASSNSNNIAGILGCTAGDGMFPTLLNNQTASVDSIQPAASHLAAEVSNNAHRTLSRGPLLLAPQKDVVVDTPNGTVNVAAKSLVLIIASEKGLAVYNMHDNRKNAVSVTREGQAFNVAPGTHAMIVGHGENSFEQVNPAEFVRYRQVNCKQLSKTAKVFQAEFEVISMLNALPAFRDLMISSDAETRKTMSDVLKTAAILMHLSQSKEPFKFFVKPSVTAMASGN